MGEPTLENQALFGKHQALNGDNKHGHIGVVGVSQVSSSDKESAKIFGLSSRKIDKYEFLRGEEILPPDQRRVIEQAKFAYSPLGTAFEKQNKLLKNKEKNKLKLKSFYIQKKNQKRKSIEGLFSEEIRNDEIKMK